MILKKKIKAFTLTEMLVVMAVSSIVVSLAYGILALFSENVLLIQSNYRDTTELRLLEERLTLDFHKYHEIRYDSEKQRLVLSTPIDSTTYRFTSDLIIHDQDSIAVKLNKVSTFYLGNTITAGYTDAVKLEFEEPKGKFLFISKENDALQIWRTYGN